MNKYVCNFFKNCKQNFGVADHTSALQQSHKEATEKKPQITPQSTHLWSVIRVNFFFVSGIAFSRKA
jgi:hypothetical protein